MVQVKPETDITEEPPKNEKQRHSAEQGTCLSGTVKEERQLLEEHFTKKSAIEHNNMEEEE